MKHYIIERIESALGENCYYKYIAIEPNGSVYAYDERPVIDDVYHFWTASGLQTKIYVLGEPYEDWYDSLMKIENGKLVKVEL